MTWEEKLDALQALAKCDIRMRKPGDWYVSQPVETAESCFLVGRYGNGATPEAAVNDHWEQLTATGPNFPKHPYLAVDAMRDTRRHVYWNGYMWRDLPVATTGVAT